MFLQRLQKNADFYPEDTALVFGSESISNAELLNRVERVAGGLDALGVSAGDRVGLVLENSPEFIVTFYAVAACGAVNVPLNIEYKSEEFGYFFEDAGVKCAIVDEPRLKAVQQAVSDRALDTEVVSTKGGDGVRAFADLLAHEPLEGHGNGSLDDHIVYIYSSGSTGRPKCAPRTVLQYWWEMEEVIQGLRLGRQDTIFCAIPLFHNFAAVQCMLAGPGSGARLVLFRSPNPFVLRRQAALKVLEEEKVTIFPGVPFIFEHLVESSKQADLSSIRVCYSAAAALQRETAVAFREKYGIPIRDHYGCTEVGAMTINLDPEPDQYSHTVGHPFPGVRIQILGEDGKPLPPNEKGEVVVGSRAMTSGYLGLDELNAEAFRDGYFHTGDLGCLDEGGRLCLLGRKKFIIDVAGHKVDPMEVEDALSEHVAVDDVIVIGVANDQGSDQLVSAYVVANRQIGAAELIAFSRERLANFKVPQHVSFISEVPKNQMGKLIRKKEALDQNLCEPGAQPAIEAAAS